MSLPTNLFLRAPSRTFCRARQQSKSVLKHTVRCESTRTRKPDGTLVIEHLPPPTSPRSAPVPLAFVGSSELERDGGAFLSLGDRLSREAASRGFMSYQFDLPFETRASDSAKDALDKLSSNLRSQIRAIGIPFAPILYAQQLGCLIAQKYVSSHPLYALILDSPPLTCASLSSWPGVAERLNLPLPEFTFEPKFPVLVLEPISAGGALKDSRLVQQGADYIEVCENAARNVGSRNFPDKSVAVERWIDELGC